MPVRRKIAALPTFAHDVEALRELLADNWPYKLQLTDSYVKNHASSRHMIELAFLTGIQTLALLIGTKIPSRSTVAALKWALRRDIAAARQRFFKAATKAKLKEVSFFNYAYLEGIEGRDSPRKDLRYF